MKTYTFKIKVGEKKVVCACNMQLEQFYESVKMTEFDKLLERYPHSYITACDYASDDGKYIYIDYVISDLKSLISSKTLKNWLSSDDFVGFVGDDDFKKDLECRISADAKNYTDMEVVEDVGDDTAV
nr:hypothetical protein LMSGXRPZ_LMSGXRPZ_CDS_0007 [Microvirus sp.]